ncbi:MAG: hypothetical protein R3F24_02375 [Gammaproteobacteria bacterium]
MGPEQSQETCTVKASHADLCVAMAQHRHPEAVRILPGLVIVYIQDLN